MALTVVLGNMISTGSLVFPCWKAGGVVHDYLEIIFRTVHAVDDNNKKKDYICFLIVNSL